MLIRERIFEQLAAKREHFHAYDDNFQRERAAFSAALLQLAQQSSAAVNARLQDHSGPGALLTAEFDSAPQLVIPPPAQFEHHAAARAWAHDILLNHTTIAVDGSQILPSPALNIPVAALQIAWFCNPHTPAGQYVKDLAVEVLTPEDLRGDYAITPESNRPFSEQIVNYQRFRLETETLCRLMSEHAAARQPNDPLPLAFFDSSLVISFIEQLNDQMREQYLQCLRQLLRCAESTRVPLIGYVDDSHARDLTRMLATLNQLSSAERINDAQLINERLAWGARTPFFICARGSSRGIQESLLDQLGKEFRRSIGFLYLKTNANNPARLEIPRWVYDAGLLDEIVQLVLAEVVVGTGYPYALETADATAVLSGRDREDFQELFRRFAEREKIELRITQKAASKARRR